ncbi:MAG: porin [Accumulibacter sp.]|jgi:predicted porin|uniref:porin n=1 Tax=Accumulibacter sp. TaxID=2053492 RepID=UPI002FC39111
MQKKLIALAVASVASGAAFAQTNVTMYGIVDAGYVYSSGDAGRAYVPALGGQSLDIVQVPGKNTFSGIQSGLLSGSRLGFRGEEALGNGLKAVFTLEYSLGIDGNNGVGSTGSLNARQQFVGLAGNFGQIALGRQYSPGYQATANNDPAAGAAFEPQSFMTAQAGNTITPNSNARWNNALTYTTPNWGGFTGKAIYSFGENSTCTTFRVPTAANPSNTTTAATYNDNCVSTTDNSRWALGANFATGGLNLDAVYQVRQKVRTTDGYIPNANNALPLVNNTNTAFATAPITYTTNSFAWGDDINEWYVGGSYDFKVVKVMASYQDQNDKNFYDNDNNTWSVGAVVPLGNANIHLAWAQTNFDGAVDGKSNGAMIAGTYAFSKRTTAYAGYVWVKNDNDSMPLNPVSANVGGFGGTGGMGESNNTFLAGIRHSF